MNRLVRSAIAHIIPQIQALGPKVMRELFVINVPDL
jgi:hypothetical protein